MFDFFTDSERRGQKTEPKSVQIFPSQEFEAVVRFDMGDADKVAVHAETKKLKIEARLFYQGADGRSFEYAAEISYAHGRFKVGRSETR